MSSATVIGAGLAGCEAAWQLASRGIAVLLIDMKPERFSPAHRFFGFAELVCSNSFRSVRLENAVGLLKEEMRRLNSLIMHCADRTRLPAGGALAVDRELFSTTVTEQLTQHPLIRIVSEYVDAIPQGGTVIVATGPLTDADLFADIRRRLSIDTLYFYDAAAPIVSAESIDQKIAFRQSRYGRGGDDYLNCPLNEEEYEKFKIGILLRKARKEAKMTQDELASLIKTKKASISRLENHSQDIKLSNSIKITVILNKQLKISLERK